MDSMFIRTDEYFINLNEIQWVEVKGKYIFIFFRYDTNGSALLEFGPPESEKIISFLASKSSDLR